MGEQIYLGPWKSVPDRSISYYFYPYEYMSNFKKFKEELKI